MFILNDISKYPPIANASVAKYMICIQIKLPKNVLGSTKHPFYE